MKRTITIVALNLCLILSLQAQILGFSSKPRPFDSQMKALTRQMVKSFGEEGKTQIAIMEFPDVDGKITELGKLIPEELTTRLFKTGEFQVVERQLLNKVLEEQKLGMSGMLDASSVAQIGKLLGVDAIVTGTVTDRGDAIRINSRMIETEQAHVFAVAQVSIIRENHLLTMLGKEISSSSSSSSTSSASSSSSSQDPGKALRKGMIGDIKVEIMSARITSSNKIEVDVVFTNKNKADQEIRFYGGYGDTKIYDNMGQEFKCNGINFGSKKGNYSGIRHRLIKGLPTKAVYVFDDVDVTATRISVFKIAIQIDREESFAEFRKIDITK